MRLLSKLRGLISPLAAPARVRTLEDCREAYCINLQSATARLEESRRQLQSIGIGLTAFPAVPSAEVERTITRRDGVSAVANGCLESHIRLYRRILDAHRPTGPGGERPYVGVFEDDIVLLPSIFELDAYFARVPADWDVVSLGGNYHYTRPEVLDEHITRPRYAFNTHAMLIRIDFLPTLIGRLEERDFEVDVKMAKLQDARIGHWYGFTRDFIWQHARDSVFHTSLWTAQRGEFHFAKLNGVVDKVKIHNELP